MLGRRSLIVSVVCAALLSPATAALSEPQSARDLSAAASTQLLPSDSAAGDTFGRDVAISGDTAAVGAPETGTAYIFVRANEGWVQQAALRAPRAAGYPGGFGSVLDLDGDTLVVGAPARDTGGGALESGSVYLFERVGTRWSLTQRIEERQTGAFRGSELALDGDTLFIGVPGIANSFYNYNEVDVWSRAGGAWTQTDTLVDPVSDGNDDGFGVAFAVDGDTAILSSDGGLLAYEQAGSRWTYQETVSSAAGTSLALAGDTFVVGIAFVDFEQPGRAAVYARSDQGWALDQVLRAPPGSVFADDFGLDVALGDGIVAVGAPHDAGFFESPGAGSVTVFVRAGSDWVRRSVVQPADTRPGDRFGIALAADGDRALVGAPDDSMSGSDPGAVYVYEPMRRASA